jgi:hypothetical protein
MKHTHRWADVRRSMAMAAAAIVTLASATGVAAQERPAGLLNTLDVRALVARGDPVDHDRLFVHFRVLWDRYLTEATRHETMAHTVTGNPNRSSGAGANEYCKQLATRSRGSANTVGELALYYKQLAEGDPATLPQGAARFQGGAGAPEPTEEELEAMGAQARTRSDHLALEEYLRMMANRHARNANQQTMLALTYRGGRFGQAAVHHERLANAARRAAAEARRVADLHRQLATIGR